MKLVTVYGSLLSGMGNWAWCLNNDRCILLGGHVIEENLGMLNLGSFPGLIHTTTKNKIFVETYSVPDDIYKRIEQLEGYRPGSEDYNLYNKFLLETPYGSSELYVYNDREHGNIKGLMEPNDGDIINWKKYKLEKQKEYENKF